MENTRGYVYVMINPSYEGILKVGKTTKEPEERAKELSSATGVATPFIVVYKRYFNNCHHAEKMIHNILEEKGVRVNSSREFFAIDITDTINLLLSIPDVSDCEEARNDGFFIKETEDASENLAETYFQQGENYYHGLNDTFQDTEMALVYYEKSANLGCSEAFRQLGHIWHNDKRNTYKAIRYFQEGIKLQNACCYAELGVIYMNKYEEEYYNEQNAHLAWSKFFEYANSCDSQSIPEQILIQIQNYLTFSRLYNNKIAPAFEQTLCKHRNKIINGIKSYIEFIKVHKPVEGERAIETQQKILEYIEGIEEKVLLSVSDEKQLAKNCQIIGLKYFKGEDGYPKNNTRSLFMFRKSLANGNILSNVFIGNVWINFNDKDKANTAWKSFYNNIYDAISNESKPMSYEDKKQFVIGLYTMFSFAIEKEVTDLIHPYYILVALHLGVIDYYSDKIALLEQNECYNSNSYTELETLENDFLNTEKQRIELEKVHTFIKEHTYRLKEENNLNGNEGVFNGKIYRLE